VLKGTDYNVILITLSKTNVILHYTM